MRIWEARSHPDQNKEHRSKEILADLERYFDNPDAYLSMTHHPKIGVYPKSPYDSPIGIYAYPLSSEDIVRRLSIPNEQGSLSLPFVGWAKYANVLIARPEKVFTNAATNDELAEIERFVISLLEKHEYKGDAADFRDHSFKFAYRAAMGNDVQICYTMTQLCVYYIALAKKSGPSVASANLQKILEYGYGIGDKFTDLNCQRTWNGLWRTMGYDAIRDDGLGFIHGNEKTQICFLSTSPIRNVIRLRNGCSGVFPPEREITSMRQLKNLLIGKKIIPEEAMNLLFNMAVPGNDSRDISATNGGETWYYNGNIRPTIAQIKDLLDIARIMDPREYKNTLRYVSRETKNRLAID